MSETNDRRRTLGMLVEREKSERAEDRGEGEDNIGGASERVEGGVGSIKNQQRLRPTLGYN